MVVPTLNRWIEAMARAGLGGTGETFFSRRALLVAALASVVGAAGWGWRENTMTKAALSAELWIATTEAGRAQLFYDRGAGMNEADSVHWQLTKSEVAQRYVVALPAGRFLAWRLDPLDRDGTLRIEGPVRISGSGGAVMREIAVVEFKAAEQIKSWREENGRLEVMVEPGASDPKLVADFSPALELRAMWWDVQSGFWMRAVAGWLALATLLWAVDRVSATPGLTRWQRFRGFLSRPPLGITLAACAAVLAARRPEMFSNPQFWAEDSITFYHAAYTRGVAAIFEPYAGYLHAVPRLTAAVAMGIDPRWAPAWFTAVALAVTLYVAARTQSARCPLVGHAGYALAVVLVPDAYEVLLNVVNLQWLIAGGLVLLLISADARGWGGCIHDGMAAVLGGLTGPFSILFCGLFWWRAWARRTWASGWLAGLVSVCAVTQAWTIWRNPVVMTGNTIVPGALLAVPGMRITAALWAGWLVPADYPRAVETALGIVALVGVAMLAVRRGTIRRERGWLALAAGALLAGALYRCRFVLPDLCHATFGSRYFYPIVMIVAWLLLEAATDRRRWFGRSAAVLVLWALVINGPRLRENAYADLRWGDYAEAIRAGRAVEVPVNPEPWVLSLPAKPPREAVARGR